MESKRLLKAVLAVQLAIVLIVGLSLLGIDIPVLRQLIGFVYLTFIPGIIVLHLFRMHNLSQVRTLLYAVGLSLAFNMFLGFIINMLYPLVGISRPISTLSLIITWTVVLSLLSFNAFKRDKVSFRRSCFKAGNLMSPSVLLLILLPLVAVLGGELVRFYQNNILLIILLCMVGIVPVLALVIKLIPEKLYPLAIYSVALALLWHFVMPFKYLVQFDSFLESYFSNVVIQAGLWDWTINHNYNAMLSVTILPAMFSQLLDISVTAIYKFVYPLWYALVPLGLYEAYRQRFSSIKSFLAVFFFVATYVFFLEAPSLGRQMIAELFFVLLLMLVMDGESSIARKALFLIFGAGLVVSHYGMSYLYLGLLFLGLIIMLVLRKRSAYIGVPTLTLLVVICLAWYMYISRAEPFTTVVNMAHHISQRFITELFNPTSRDMSYWILTAAPNALFVTFRILWYLMLFFMAIGATTLFSDLRRKEARKEYTALAIGGYILIGASVVIPLISNFMGAQRMFHISSLILAPYCVLGAETIFRCMSRAIRYVFQTSTTINWQVAITALLVLFFFFNSYLPFELTNSPLGRSLPLAIGQVRSGDKSIALKQRIWMWSTSPIDQEVSSAEWLNEVRCDNRPVWATWWQIGVPALLSYGMIPWSKTYYLTPLTTDAVQKGDYVYLGYVNMVLGYGTTRALPGQPDPIMGDTQYWPISEVFPLLDKCSKVYTNLASEIYWTP